MKTTDKEKSQVEKFRKLTREIGTADSEEPLNAALRKVVKTPPPKENKPKEMKD